MSTVCLVMIVRNESKNLDRCLESVKNFVNEIIIVDTGSIDDTKLIALRHGAKLYEFNWIDDFSAARNYGIEKSTSNWNLVLDADEYIIEGHELLKEFARDNHPRIGRIKIINWTNDGSEDKETINYVSRLFPRGVSFKGKIHEQLDSNLSRLNIDIVISHDGYYKNNKVDRNLKILMSELQKNKQDSYILYQLGKQFSLIGNSSESVKFLGKSFNLAHETDYYRPLMVVDYLYEIIKEKEFELGIKIIKEEKTKLDFYTDFHFVCGLFFLEYVFYDLSKNADYFQFIERSFLRCLEIGEMYQFDSVKGTGSYLAFYNLGVYNEVIGKNELALFLFNESAKLGYKKAEERLDNLKSKE